MHIIESNTTFNSLLASVVCDNVCKEFEPRSDHTVHRVIPESQILYSDGISERKEFLEYVGFETI